MSHTRPQTRIPMKTWLVALTALLPASPAFAVTTVTGTWNVSTAIPDNSDTGFTSSPSLSETANPWIQSVSVRLVVSGGWNGDLYAYLVHGGTMSVLLNRPGSSLANPAGAASSGMTVDLSDLAPLDIHTALPDSGAPAGTYQPDGRTTDPSSALDTDARTAPLSAFNGMNVNGTWKLFVADMSPGDVSTLESWSLTINTVPEPSAAVLAGLGIAGMLLARRRGQGVF